MIGLIVTGHGHFATGLTTSLNLIAGDAKDYVAVDFEATDSTDDLAKKLGKSRSHITNMIGLLNLPEEVQKLLSSKEISAGHARIISKLENEEQQISLAKKVVDEGLSVRQLEDITHSNEKFLRVHEIKRKPKETNSEYMYLQEELCEKLGTKVKIKTNKIEISFVNGNDLNRLLEIMNLESRR